MFCCLFRLVKFLCVRISIVVSFVWLLVKRSNYVLSWGLFCSILPRKVVCFRAIVFCSVTHSYSFVFLTHTREILRLLSDKRIYFCSLFFPFKFNNNIDQVNSWKGENKLIKYIRSVWIVFYIQFVNFSALLSGAGVQKVPFAIEFFWWTSEKSSDKIARQNIIHKSDILFNDFDKLYVFVWFRSFKIRHILWPFCVIVGGSVFASFWL